MGKVILEKKGESSKINLSKNSNKLEHIGVKLEWTKSVDLDLHAFYISKDGKKGQIYFGNKNEAGISLDKDAGVGNTAGNNQENLVVEDISNLKYILFATNIFRLLGFLHGNDSFSKYDGKVLVKTDLSEIEVPLNAKEKGKWAAIALIDNSGSEPKVVNINQISADKPDIEKFI